MIGINMEMTKSCEECKFVDYDYWCGYSCKINGVCLNDRSMLVNGIDEEYKNERHPKCSLVYLDNKKEGNKNE